MHDLQRIARDYPDSPVPPMREGDMLRGKQRFAEAIAAYDRAIARIKAPTRERLAGLLRSRHLLRARAPMDARPRPTSSDALALSPDQPFVLNYLGYSWADMGQNLAAGARNDREGGAAPAERRRDRRQPGLGDAAPGRRRRGGAARSSARSSWSRRTPSINGHLGDAYWAAGRKLEATYQWRRALIFNPEPDDAAKLEAKLQRRPAVDRGAAASSFVPDRLTEHGAGQGQPLPARDRPPGRTATTCWTAWSCSPASAIR